ncbi:MAG: methionine adenosyltransferase [Pseudomonadota bacterium]
MRQGFFTFTSESVTEGHPDKVCDRISDTVLDRIIAEDPKARVACETVAGGGFILVTGEITTKAYVNIKAAAQDALKYIGYDKPEYGFDYKSVGILTSINEQSTDIAMGVNATKDDDYGAGDQGMMSGYATSETAEYMPAPILYAQKLTAKLAEVRKNNTLKYLRPDGKSQVTVDYENGKPKRISAVVIATQHDEDVTTEQIRADVRKYVINPVCGNLIDDNTKMYINNTGRFVIGGPVGDTGCTGRKIIVDTYGGVGNHGGGAFSGKDPTKVDRTAAYFARYLTKNIVAAGLADRCELQLSYAIGSREPISIFIDTHNTSKVDVQKILVAVRERFDLSPGKMIDYLNLRRPIFAKTSAYGHFGRNDPDFTWEKLDLVDYFKKACS